MARSFRTRSSRRWPMLRCRHACRALFLTRDSPLKLHFRFDPVQWRWAFEFLRHANTKDARRTTAGLLKLAELSREFIEPLIEGEGIDCHFTRGGKLVVYPDTRSLASAHAQVLYQAGLGSKQTVLTRAQCVEQEPALEAYAQRIAGGVWTRQRRRRRLR